MTVSYCSSNYVPFLELLLYPYLFLSHTLSSTSSKQRITAIHELKSVRSLIHRHGASNKDLQELRYRIHG